MAEQNDNHKTALSNPLNTALDPHKTLISSGVEPSTDLLTSELADSDEQLTRYSGGHNHSAGFAQARELVQQSLSGKLGLLLKKRFLLEAVLGHGGMGTVYKTKDLRKVEAEDPNPYIATKILNQDFKDHPDAFVTLQQETAKSQALAHPNIVTVHDFDRDGDTLFMTMELLEGEPLDQLLKKNRLKGMPKEQVWSITRDLCAALSYAHQRQLIHADFKPGNIFVNTQFGAKVLDFGIARAATKEAQKHKFDAGQLGALTPAYASIEMIKDEPLSFSDDVYALACVVYEMLAGRHPYNNCSALEAQRQHLKPARIDALSGSEWRALVQALSITKAERTPSVDAFAEKLFPKRKPFMVFATLAVALFSLLGAAWFAYSEYQADSQLEATIAEKIQRAEACYARADYTCAIEQSLVATNLDAENTQAQVLLAQAQAAKLSNANAEKLQQLVREAGACLAAEDLACTQVKAREALAIKKDNQAALTLLAQANQQLQDQTIEAFIAQGQDCLQQQDFSCAQLFIDKAQAVNRPHEGLDQLVQQLAAQQQHTQVQQRAQLQKIQQGVQQAQACFGAQDYACAIAKAEQVLALDIANVAAVEIRQRATFAQQQAQELSAKTDRLLVQANNCMLKKNYACAIAKAESALDLDAGNRRAAAVKQKALDTQRQLKETGLKIQ